MNYYPFHFVEKKFESWTCSEELQGLASCTHTVFALLEGSIEKNCFKMEWVLPLFLYGTKSWQNNGPNGQPAQCMTPSEFYKNTGTYIIGFCVYVFVVVRPFATDDGIVYLHVNILNFSRPRLIKFSKIRKQLLLLLRLRVRQGRCCVDLW